MFDAKKRKRGELFNVSITEVILLLLFLLLLLFTFLYKDLEKKYNKLKNNNQEIAELLRENEGFRDTTGYTGPAQIKDELDILGASTENLRDTMYLFKERVSELEEKIKKLEAELEILDSIEDLENIEDIDQKIEDIVKFKGIFEDSNSEQVDKLVKGLETLLKENNNNIEELIEKIEDLAGNAIPRCWPLSYPDLNGKDAERIFTIRLQSSGIWVEPDFNERFNKEYKYLNLDEKYFRVPLSESLFVQAFKPLFDLSEKEDPLADSVTEQRRCRHEVRIFDELPELNDKYKPQTTTIESYFYTYEFDDSYCDFRKKYRKDNICKN